MDDVTTRFYSKTEPASDGSGCLLWASLLFRDGYGQFSVDTRPVRAHRWIYQKHHDVVLTKDQWVLHSCDNPRCVNVAHLRVGSHIDNQRDMVSRSRSCHSEKNVKAKLTSDQVQSIRAEYARGGVTQKELGRRYGVRQQTISWITSGKHWTRVG